MYNTSEPESDKIDLIAFGVDASVFFKSKISLKVENCQELLLIWDIWEKEKKNGVLQGDRCKG